MALSTIELFAGVGMLGEGVGAGLAYMGMQHRPVCYVEREAYAASVLVARMQEGSLAQAPVWSDITTFNASQFAGKVDGILAGFPCQDLSIAGAREGLDGDRSGLFFEIPKIADACGAWFLFLENVAAIASATATVMDEEEGELEERAAARVLGELADRGWNAEWITLSASDVGASHGRARWFCFAWRQLVNATGARQQESGPGDKRELSAQVECGLHNRPEFSGGKLGDTKYDGCIAAQDTESNTEGNDRDKAWALSDGKFTGPGNTQLAYTSSEGFKRLQFSSIFRTRGWEQRGTVSQLCGLFAPGPEDFRWSSIIKNKPELAPALEPTFCELVNGLAFNMDDCRAARLKCVGNGVVALCAATAFVLLATRSGIFNSSIETETVTLNAPEIAGDI